VQHKAIPRIVPVAERENSPRVFALAGESLAYFDERASVRQSDVVVRSEQRAFVVVWLLQRSHQRDSPTDRLLVWSWR